MASKLNAVAPISIANVPVTFSVDAKLLPEIKGWKVGSKYNLNLEVEMVGQSTERDFDTDPNKKMSEMTARFKIITAKGSGGSSTSAPEPTQARLNQRAAQGK